MFDENTNGVNIYHNFLKLFLTTVLCLKVFPTWNSLLLTYSKYSLSRASKHLLKKVCQKMVLDLCLCSVSLIDEIIWIKICVIVFDPMIITILDLALCCVVSRSIISWFFMEMAAKRLYSVVVSTLSRPWFGTNTLIGKSTRVFTLPG